METFNYKCAKCESITEFRSGFGGMGDDVLVFCDRCGKYTSFSGYDPVFMKMIDTYGLKAKKLNAASPVAIKSCSCGGRFQSSTPQRCAECKEPVSLDDLQSQHNRKVPHNFLHEGTKFPGWEKWCSFCGSKEKELTLIDCDTRTYICKKCQETS